MNSPNILKSWFTYTTKKGIVKCSNVSELGGNNGAHVTMSNV